MAIGTKRARFYLALGVFVAWVGFLAAMAATTARKPSAKLEAAGQPE